MGIEIKVTCDECNRVIHLDDVTYCFECYESLLARDSKFINHIKSHLKEGEKVICKICGKSADEIIEEAKNEKTESKCNQRS